MACGVSAGVPGGRLVNDEGGTAIAATGGATGTPSSRVRGGDVRERFGDRADRCDAPPGYSNAAGG